MPFALILEVAFSCVLKGHKRSCMKALSVLVILLGLGTHSFAAEPQLEVIAPKAGDSYLPYQPTYSRQSVQVKEINDVTGVWLNFSREITSDCGLEDFMIKASNILHIETRPFRKVLYFIDLPKVTWESSHCSSVSGKKETVLRKHSCFIEKGNANYMISFQFVFPQSFNVTVAIEKRPLNEVKASLTDEQKNTLLEDKNGLQYCFEKQP